MVAAVDAADHGDSAGADQLDDAERPHQVDEGFDLFFLAGDFDHDFVGRDVDDAAAEDFGQLADFGPLAGLHLDLDQHQVAFDVVARADVVDAHDGDDLFELLADLFEHAVVADDDERHPREPRVFGFADGEAIDVVAARGEHAGHVGQHAGDVLHGGGKDVTHVQERSAMQNVGEFTMTLIPGVTSRAATGRTFAGTTMMYGAE